MLKKIILPGLVMIATLISLFILVVSLQPAGFTIERSITISAMPEVIFPYVDDLHAFNEWSPWAKLDPAVKDMFEGPSTGPGATFKWSGNDKVGEGSMTIIHSHPNDLIGMKLDFVRPFAASNIVEFSFKPMEKQTVVTWSMSGQKNFGAKAAGLFMNMDKIVGGDFEKGLMQLKGIAEAKLQPPTTQPEPATNEHQ